MSPIPSLKPHIIILTALAFIALIEAIGTVAYMFMENWSFVDSLYFTTMTLTTIGFGDLVPTHDFSKLFTVVFAFIGVGSVLFFITLISKFYFQHKMLQMAHLENKIHDLMTPKGVKKAEKEAEEKVEKIDKKAEQLAKVEKKIKKEAKEVKKEEREVESKKHQLKNITKKIK